MNFFNEFFRRNFGNFFNKFFQRILIFFGKPSRALGSEYLRSCFPLFTLHFHSILGFLCGELLLFLLKRTDFWVENTKNFFGAKKANYQKKIQLDFSSKIEVLSLARLDSETFQLGSTQLGKSQLEYITTNYVLLFGM